MEGDQNNQQPQPQPQPQPQIQQPQVQRYYDPILGIVVRNIFRSTAQTEGENLIGNLGIDSVARSLGIAKEMDRNYKFASYLANPGSYFTLKNQRLAEIARNLTRDMQAEQGRLLDNGESYEKAFEKAREYAKKRRETYYEQLRHDFPESIEKTITNKLGGKNNN